MKQFVVLRNEDQPHTNLEEERCKTSDGIYGRCEHFLNDTRPPKAVCVEREGQTSCLCVCVQRQQGLQRERSKVSEN